MLLDRGELKWEGLVEYIIFCWITGNRNIPQICRMLCFVADEMSASNSLILGEITSGGGS